MKSLLPLLVIGGALSAAAQEKDITAYHKKVMGLVQYNKHGVAHIVTKEGWVAINRQGKILYRPFIYDNGPDYVKEDLLRYTENGKIGFVDEAGNKVIPATFDFAEPFENGYAVFCNGCKAVKSGEHTIMDKNSGSWGKVDKKGRVSR